MKKYSKMRKLKIRFFIKHIRERMGHLFLTMRSVSSKSERHERIIMDLRRKNLTLTKVHEPKPKYPSQNTICIH